MSPAGVERLYAEIVKPEERCCYCSRPAITACEVCVGLLCTEHGGVFVPPVCCEIDICTTHSAAQAKERERGPQW